MLCLLGNQKAMERISSIGFRFSGRISDLESVVIGSSVFIAVVEHWIVQSIVTDREQPIFVGLHFRTMEMRVMFLFGRRKSGFICGFCN